MGAPTAEHVAEFKRAHGSYRVACTRCFRDDFDGVKRLPIWPGGVDREQTLVQSMTTYGEPGDPPCPPGIEDFAWWTHIGLCPDCHVDQGVVIKPNSRKARG